MFKKVFSHIMNGFLTKKRKKKECTISRSYYFFVKIVVLLTIIIHKIQNYDKITIQFSVMQMYDFEKKNSNIL